MRIETIAMRGVLRFNATTTLDLRDIPSGIVALVGENGGGKTTTLEATIACLYRQFPSRDKEVLDYVTASDGFIEVSFELEGQGLYTARLSLDGPHRKAEGVLSRILPDGQQVFLNDGKVTTFDAAVRKLLPPPELLLASVFAAQNRVGSFARLPPKGRKALFTTLLGLDHYELMAERAKSAASLVQDAIIALGATRSALARDASVEQEDALELLAQQLQIESGTVETRRRELAETLADLEASVAVLQEAATAYHLARTTADRVDVELVSRQTEQARVAATLTAFDEEIVTERARITSTATSEIAEVERQTIDTSAHAAEIDAIHAALATTRQQTDARIAKNQELQAQGERIRVAVAHVEEIDQRLAALRVTSRTATESADPLRRRERVLTELLAVIGLAKRDLAAAEADAGLIGTVPFGEDCEKAACRFVSNAALAKARIPALRESAASEPAATEELRGVREQMAALASQVQSSNASIVALEQERRETATIADRLPDLMQAEARIAAHEQTKLEATSTAQALREAAVRREAQRVEDLQRRLVSLRVGLERHLAQFDTRAAKKRHEIREQAAQVAERITALEAERLLVTSTLDATAAASANAAEQQALLNAARREWDGTTARLSAAESKRDDLERRRRDFRARRDELAVVEARIDALQTDYLEWDLLRKALGRDGLQVLEIDAAGPTVSTFCNDLLQSCGMGRFSVELITQEAKRSAGKDGSTMKDSFELRIYDSERGGDPRDLSDLSGGEQIIVDEALKSAIALLVNTRNQFPLRTCWRDETTGALDSENARRYIDMLRRVHQLGGFHHTLFISHNPDAAAAADAQVRFHDGQISVVLPPFSVAA